MKSYECGWIYEGEKSTHGTSFVQIPLGMPVKVLLRNFSLFNLVVLLFMMEPK